MNDSTGFSPDRNDACFCGSGRRFKNCCGSLAPDRLPPHGLQVIERYLDAGQCRQLTEYADTRPGEPLMVVDTAASTANHVVKKLDPGRVTERVDLGQEQARINQIVRDALTMQAAPYLGAMFEWFEEPQLLRYRAGGFYKGHADSDKYDEESARWTRVLDRDVSLLLYLNDEYTGGTLSFPNFHYTLRPRPGMLVFFPSDNRYYHSANPVLSGIRYAIVSWAALHGVPRVHGEPTPGAIYMNS